MKYRIIKQTFESGDVRYVIQKKMRLFGIGPRVWQSYHHDVWGDQLSDWHYFFKMETRYHEEKDAICMMNKLINDEESDHLINEEVCITTE